MLNPRWRKVIRDLWSNKTRTVLVVLAIAVGVFAFGSVFITQTVLIEDMNDQYREINASTITFFIDSFDDSLVRWAQRQDEITDAQGRAVYLVKLIKENEIYNLDLYAYDDYGNISLNKIEYETGKWPPGRRELILERASAAVAGLATGDEVIVEMPDGSRRELSLVGTAHDINAVPANLFPQLSGYVTTKTLGLLGLPSNYNRLEMRTTEQYSSIGELETVANELKERLRKAGVDINGVQIREPGEHWAKEVTQSFTLILSFIGFFSLILSGFLVVNTMSALLTEQRRQIGMMKAIGGTGGQVIGIYLVLVLFFGLLSLLVAVPVGMGLGYVFTLAVVRFLNIDLLNFYLPLPVLLMQVVAALVVPVLASLLPIIGGVRVTVREAISSHGIASRAGHGRFDQMVMSLRRLPRPVLLSLRNTFRRRWRLALTLGALTLAGTLFITVVNVRSSLMAEFNNIVETVFNYEVVLTLDGKYKGSGVERRVESVPGVTNAEARTSVSVRRIKPDGTEGANFSIVGLYPDSEFIKAAVLSGRWLEKGDQNAVVLSSNLAEDMTDVKVGDTIISKVGDEKYEWNVVGIVLMAFDRVGYADFNYVSEVRGESGLASSVHVSTEQKDGASQTKMAKTLEEELKQSGVNVLWSMTRDTITSSNESQFDFLVAFLLTMAGMTALIGGLGLAGMMSLNVIERTREIGVMRSIGASNWAIGSIVVTEGLFIGILSWILAIPLSVPINLAFNAMLGELFVDEPLIYIFSPIGMIGWLLIVVVVSAIASLLPAYRAVLMSIRETLAYE